MQVETDNLKADEEYLSRKIEAEHRRRKDLLERLNIQREATAKELAVEEEKKQKLEDQKQLKRYLEKKVAEEMEAKARDDKGEKLVREMMDSLNLSSQDVISKPIAKVLGYYQGNNVIKKMKLPFFYGQRFTINYD